MPLTSEYDFVYFRSGLGILFEYTVQSAGFCRTADFIALLLSSFAADMSAYNPSLSQNLQSMFPVTTAMARHEARGALRKNLPWIF
jgi:hypothetical protein